MQKYNRKVNQVTAVQLTEAKTYEKWGGTQQAKEGDWWVNNEGEEYSIDADSFAQTYKQVEGDTYTKVSSVYAIIATQDGKLSTKEGKSDYVAGDYLVANNKDGTDQYPVSADKFESRYVVALPLKLSPELVTTTKEFQAFQEEQRKQYEAKHTEFWAKIHAEHPTLDPDEEFTVDVKLLDLDVVILKETESAASGLPAALKAAFAEMCKQ